MQKAFCQSTVRRFARSLLPEDNSELTIIMTDNSQNSNIEGTYGGVVLRQTEGGFTTVYAISTGLATV